MTRSYAKTLFVTEVNKVFPFITKIKSNFFKKSCQLFFGVFISPVFLYKLIFCFYIPYTELVLTTKCSLCCVNCANLMPHYKMPYDVPLDTLLKSLESLTLSCDGIYLLTLMGGEPFMYKDIDIIIKAASENKKVHKLKIVTNGTIAPGRKTLDALKNKKVTVAVSLYPGVDISRLLELFKKEDVRFNVMNSEFWTDYGTLNKRSFDVLTLTKSFLLCPSSECKTILNGRLFTCPRSSHGADLGFIPPFLEDYVDLLSGDREKIKIKLKNLYNRPYVAACDHCNPCWNRAEIEVALQKKEAR